MHRRKSRFCQSRSCLFSVRLGSGVVHSLESVYDTGSNLSSIRENFYLGPIIGAGVWWVSRWIVIGRGGLWDVRACGARSGTIIGPGGWYLPVCLYGRTQCTN